MANAQTLPNFASPGFVKGPLHILYSCRIKLDEEQRQVLREAHNKFRNSFAPTPSAPVMAGSTLSVETSHGVPGNAYALEGLSDLVISDILGTRETISIVILLKVQRLLGVKVLDRKVLMDAFGSYLDYLEV